MTLLNLPNPCETLYTSLFRSDRPDENDPELGDDPLPENDEDAHDYESEERPIKTNEMICRKYYTLRNQRDANDYDNYE